MAVVCVTTISATCVHPLYWKTTIFTTYEVYFLLWVFHFHHLHFTHVVLLPTTFDLCVIVHVSESKIQTWSCLASFPGPARSLLSVRNSRRGPWLVHHVMCAAGRVFTSADNVCCVAEYMYKGVRSIVVNFRWGVRGAEPLVRPRNPPWPGLVWPMYLNI